jgi:hypothetical protein
MPTIFFKRRVRPWLVLFACLGAGGSAQAQGEGIYDVTGTDARSGAGYSGKVAITSTGPETWRLTWTFGTQQHDGFGLGDGKTMSVLFATGEGQGIVVYTWNGRDTYEGRWAFRHQTHVGTERLTRR